MSVSKISLERFCFLCSFFGILISGCAGVTPIEFSRPAVSLATERKMIDEQILQLDSLDLWLRMPRENFHSSLTFVGPFIFIPVPIFPVPHFWPKRKDPLWLEVYLDAKGRGFSFDPRRVTLQLNDGKSLNPTNVLGPGNAKENKDAPSRERWGCETKTPYYRQPVGPIPFGERSCFLLRFDTLPPSPDQPFVLLIEGITRVGVSVRMPPIQFEKASGWEFDTL